VAQGLTDEFIGAVDKLGLLRAFLTGWRGSRGCVINQMESQVDEWITALSTLYRLHAALSTTHPAQADDSSADEGGV
jgi:hypothetical protein